MGRYREAAIAAKNLTNKQLADELAAISTFNREKVQDLLPEKKDKEAFIKLMEQVEADTAMDEKLAFLQDNIKTVGSVAFKLLKTFI